MQVISDKIRPEQGALTNPFLNLSFVAGRAKSKDMFEHSKKVFERAFEMIDKCETAAKNSGDREMLRKIEELRLLWEEKSKRGVLGLGMEDLNRAVGNVKRLGTTPQFQSIREGMENSDVNMTVRGLQGVLDPYARDIWGDGGEGVDQLNNLTEQSKQYSNKSEAIIGAPLWRRGLERIWQAFGRVTGTSSTAEQYATLRDSVNEVYMVEIKGDGEIGKWFEDYSHKTFIAHVLSKAREEGSIYGIRTTLENAMKTPESYAAHGWKKAEANMVAHFKEETNNLKGELEGIKDASDGKIAELNYRSIELARSINSMREKITKGSEIDTILRESHKNFENAAKRLGMNLHDINNIGQYDFATQKAEESFQLLRQYFRERYFANELPIFQNEEEMEKLFERMEKGFINSYAKRNAIFEELVRGGSKETNLEEVGAPVLW